MVCLMLLSAMEGCYNRESPMDNEQDQNTSSKAENDLPQSSQQYPAATFAGGCFWGTEYVFQQVPGVESTAVGFMGGRVDNPTYKQICYTDTNHAEVVQLRYDPDQISYEKLVKVFFKTHDPTTLNRQGPDVGTQYRSAIFYHDDQQKQTAEKVKTTFDASGKFKNPIVTEIAPAKEFWKAEDYHQDYFEKNPNHPACHIIDLDRILKD
jgi:peptide-methionine (S)-S-oxide reductase